MLLFPTDGTKYKPALGSPDHHMGEQSSLTEAAVESYWRETAGLKSLEFNRRKQIVTWAREIPELLSRGSNRKTPTATVNMSL